MYIDFNDYPPYSGRISGFFKQILMKIIQCDHGYAYSSRKQKMCTWVNK